ncbi:putative defense protein 3 [Watersipora subatra]|uniref:putative defense protein 3 n=1 Tax=Watersipora subatra TaxID=2589382 RepID=UPI00355C9944
MNLVWLSLIVTAVCFTYVTCHGRGATAAACANLAPKHASTRPQTTTSPYGIQIDDTDWNDFGKVSVSFTGGPVNGFLLQARKKTDDAGIGMFGSSLPNGAQLGPCKLDGADISVTHTNPDAKSNLTFSWTFPEDNAYNGEIYFQAAFAKDHDTYWTNVVSSPIVRVSNLTTAAPVETTTHKELVTTTQKLPETSTSAGCLATVSTFLMIIMAVTLQAIAQS